MSHLRRPHNPSRLIGVEYMITSRLYKTLDKEERLLWHSHGYEARSQHPSSPPPFFSSPANPSKGHEPRLTTLRFAAEC